MSEGNGTQKLVDLRGLETYFYTYDGVVKAVDGVSYHINRSETLGLVGESGSGKSVSALSIMRLVPSPPGRYVSGQIMYGGRDMLLRSESEMRSIRGNDIAMIFQEPMTSLNPVFTIGRQITEAIRIHQQKDAKEAMAEAVHLLELVGMPDPGRRIHEYPHRLSGGMRQRAMIAMALSCQPKLLIADEPTTALDVTIQAQILELMKRLKAELGMAILLITHDLGVVAEMAERVAVMYSGKVVEQAGVKELFATPLHPYTEGLFTCIPRLDRPQGKLRTIEGVVPNPLHFPSGCRFHPRCIYVKDVCRKEAPELENRGSRAVACHFPLNTTKAGGDGGRDSRE